MAKRLLNRTVFYVVMFFVWLAYSFRFLARYCTQHFEGVSRKSNSRAPVFYRRSPWEWTTRRSDTKRLCQLHGGWLPHLWKLWVINSLAGMPVFRVLLRFFSILLKKFCPLCFFLSDWITCSCQQSQTEKFCTKIQAKHYKNVSNVNEVKMQKTIGIYNGKNNCCKITRLK